MNATDVAGAMKRGLAAGQAHFGKSWRPTIAAVAPGRLELLGNHVDYNGGIVLAAAIDRNVHVIIEVKETGGEAVEVVFADVPRLAPQRLDIDNLANWRNPSPPPGPPDFVRGALAALQARQGTNLRAPARIAIAGDVPRGLGLSSSAALCVALTLGLGDARLDDRTLILAAQEAEHRAGTPCGTMDQSASVGGGVIRYDGSGPSLERLSPDLSDHVFAVADSGIHRSLGASSYPMRVGESNEALTILRERLDEQLISLATVTTAQLTDIERDKLLPDQLFRRVRHIVTEGERVARGTLAMQIGDWKTFGRLMTESGRSSAVDYEISHPRVEELVAESLSLDGVLGARMMGGGEGGIALVLLPKQVVPRLIERLNRGYYHRHRMHGRSDGVHVFGFAQGAHLIDINS